MHDKDPVCPLDRGEAVRDDDRRASLDEPAKSFSDADLRFRIDTRCGFIEHQDPWTMCEGAGETHQLLLPG